MTLNDIKNKVKEEDCSTIDILFSMYKSLFMNISDELSEIGIYYDLLQTKYGKELIDQISETDEYKSIKVYLTRHIK